VFGKTCDRCDKPNHFAIKCCSGKNVKTVEGNNEVDDMPMDPKTSDTSTIDDEVFPAQISQALDDLQYLTLQINSKGHV